MNTRTLVRRAAILAGIALILAAILAPTTALAQDGDNDDPFLLRIEGTHTIPQGETLGTVIIIDGDLIVEGEISNFVLVVDGTIEVRNGGSVAGDIIAVDSDVTLRDGSDVSADVHVDDSSQLIIETGASFTGQTSQDFFEFDTDFVLGVALYFLIFAAAWLIFSSIMALVFAGVGAQQLRSSARLLTARPLGVILAGIVIFIIVAIASASFLFWFVFAAPFATVGLTLIQLLWFLGLIVVGTRVGAAILDRDLNAERAGKPYGPAVVGTLIVQLLVLISTAGGLFLGLAALANTDTEFVGPLVGIPTAILGFIIAIAGFLGGGALGLRAYQGWRAS